MWTKKKKLENRENNNKSHFPIKVKTLTKVGVQPWPKKLSGGSIGDCSRREEGEGEREYIKYKYILIVYIFISN